MDQLAAETRRNCERSDCKWPALLGAPVPPTCLASAPTRGRLRLHHGFGLQQRSNGMFHRQRRRRQNRWPDAAPAERLEDHALHVRPPLWASSSFLATSSSPRSASTCIWPASRNAAPGEVANSRLRNGWCRCKFRLGRPQCDALGSNLQYGGMASIADRDFKCVVAPSTAPVSRPPRSWCTLPARGGNRRYRHALGLYNAEASAARTLRARPATSRPSFMPDKQPSSRGT